MALPPCSQSMLLIITSLQLSPSHPFSPTPFFLTVSTPKLPTMSLASGGEQRGTFPLSLSSSSSSFTSYCASSPSPSFKTRCESCDDIQNASDRCRSLQASAGASRSISGPWCISDGSVSKLTMSWQERLFEHIDTPSARSRGSIDPERGGEDENTWLDLKTIDLLWW